MPAEINSSDDDTNSSKESDGEYESSHNSDVDMRMENHVDAQGSIDSNGDVNMERDGDKEDDEEEEKENEEKENEDEKEGEDEDDAKESRTIGQGEMLHQLAHFVDSMADNKTNVLPDQSQQLRKNTPQPQPVVPAPRAQTPLLRLQPQMPETHPLCGLEDLGLGTAQNPRPAVPPRWQAEATRHTLAVDVDQPLLG